MVKKISQTAKARWQKFCEIVPGMAQMSILIVALVAGLLFWLGGLTIDTDHFVIAGIIGLAWLVYAVFVGLEVDDHFDRVELIGVLMAVISFNWYVTYDIPGGNTNLPLFGSMRHASTDFAQLGQYLVFVAVIGIVFNAVFDRQTAKQNLVRHVKYNPAVWFLRGPLMKRFKEANWTYWRAGMVKTIENRRKRAEVPVRKTPAKPEREPDRRPAPKAETVAPPRAASAPATAAPVAPKPAAEPAAPAPAPAPQQRPSDERSGNGARIMLVAMLSGRKPNMGDESERRKVISARTAVGKTAYQNPGALTKIVGNEDLVRKAGVKTDRGFDLPAVQRLIDQMVNCPVDTQNEFVDLVFG